MFVGVGGDAGFRLNAGCVVRRLVGLGEMGRMLDRGKSGTCTRHANVTYTTGEGLYRELSAGVTDFWPEKTIAQPWLWYDLVVNDTTHWQRLSEKSK